MEPVARILLGEPNRALSSKLELRYGHHGSMSVDLRKGTWFDHEANEGGGTLDLIERQTGLHEAERFEWLTQNTNYQEEPKPNGHNRGAGKLGRLDATYSYVDEAGEFLFEVVRFDPKDFRQRRRPRSGDDPSKIHDGWVWSVAGIRPAPYRLPELIEAIANERTIFIAEGEKACDALWRLGLPATTNAGGAGKWRPELDQVFDGADIVILPDYDPQKTHPKTKEPMFHPDGRPILPGQDHALAVAKSLSVVAQRVRVLDLGVVWPNIKPKGDIADWIAAGGTADVLYALVEDAPDWSQDMTLRWPGQQPAADVITIVHPFPIDEPSLPVRDWAIPGMLMRKQITVLVAPSGSGKSLLTLQLSIACAQGKPWSGWRPRKAFRVLVINSEDDVDEIRRRLAAAARVMQVDQIAIRNNVAVLDSTNGSAVVAKFDAKTKTLTRTPRLEEIIKIITENQIDIVFVDPFAETFEGDENSNSELKWAGMLWREVARRTNTALCLVHHTKKYATGMAGDVDAARGAGALIGIARIVSTLFPMTAREAEAMGVKENEHGFYLRYDDAKANLNIKSPFARWFRKQTITLDNKTDELPGDDVGVLIEWAPVGPTVLEAQIHAFFLRVDKGVLDQNGKETGEFYTFARDSERFIGDFAREFFEIESQAAADKLIEGWRQDHRLEQVRYRSGRQRKARMRVISECDPQAPKNVKAQAEIQPDQQNEFDYELSDSGASK
jgi:hypothetical protein